MTIKKKIIEWRMGRLHRSIEKYKLFMVKCRRFIRNDKAQLRQLRGELDENSNSKS